MFIDLDKPRYYTHDFSSLASIIYDCKREGFKRQEIVNRLCRQGCEKSTAYAAISKYNLTTNDIELTLKTLEYLGIGFFYLISNSCYSTKE